MRPRNWYTEKIKKIEFLEGFGAPFLWLFPLKTYLKIKSKNNSQKNEKKVILTVFLGRAGGMCGRRGETREGSEIQNCRILEKDIGKEFFKSSFVNSCTVVVQHARPFPTVRAAESFPCDRTFRRLGPKKQLRSLFFAFFGELFFDLILRHVLKGNSHKHGAPNPSKN